MEVYVLDDLFRRIAVIDRYESLIWTERWQDKGDFAITIVSNRTNRGLLRTGTYLAMNESDRVMEVEYVEDKVDDEGRKLLNITGPSLEYLLEDRIATDGMNGLTDNSDWLITGTPGAIARSIFKQICVDGLLDPGDIIPFYKTGSIYPADTIPEDSTVYEAAVPLGTVYKSIKDICDPAELGFRLVRNYDKSELYFNIYSGIDRTTQQTTYKPVIFSPELANMKNTTEVNSIKEYKNVAYVFGKNGAVIVYGAGASSTTTGFERRVLVVDAKDVTDAAGPALTSILQNKGLDALAKANSLFAFDGEVTQYSPFKYGRDYLVGDIVEARNDDGATNHMRVTEQIFVSDKEGDRSYPTLTVNRYIMPGTWETWGNETWADGDPNQVWGDEDLV
jgi:hypothetical protein